MAKFETQTQRTQRIMKELLHALDMNITELSQATGVNYMVLYNASSGRKKQLDEETINTICNRYPHISHEFMSFGTGDVTVDPNQETLAEFKKENEIRPDDLKRIMERAIALLDKVLAREDVVDMKIREILERERKLTERENALKNLENSKS